MTQTINFVESISLFAEKHIKPFVLDWDKQGAFPRELFDKLGDMGLLGILTPMEYGGLSLGYEEYAEAIVAVAGYCGSLGLSIAAHNSLISQHIVQYGNDTQKRKYLPGLAAGNILGAWALTEPSAGSDAGNAQCTATRIGDHWSINGNKTFITHGASADVTVVMAKTGNKKNELTAFLVEKSIKGFSSGKPLEKLGMKACETAELFFDDCIVSNENQVGNVGDGFKQAMQILDGGRISIAALSLGIAKGAYTIALDYAQKREQFGKPIVQFQATGFKLAELATEIHAAALMLKDVCQRKGQGMNTLKESAMCKLYTSELAVRVSNDAVQILGGYGYIRDYLVEKHYRDAKLCTIGEGTSEIQKLIILREITK